MFHLFLHELTAYPAQTIAMIATAVPVTRYAVSAASAKELWDCSSSSGLGLSVSKVWVDFSGMVTIFCGMVIIKLQ